ncbi:MAG: bifunctional ADP-dependent NAD(P)H-hydrate dehydratase/NAD(P)H-hydrate epimerase, partial [Ferrovum sp.]|nr:bifunctional ADP-dependent NAD(P)H-hydrate dehydratase/NAD(P)H-hydrate epimerase [Ferrovum sp.]
MDLLTLDEIRAAENQAFLTQTPYALMTRAGNAAAAWIRSRFPVPGMVLILVGPGNNGGDGWVVARELLQCGYEATVVATGDPDRLSADAAQARRDYLAAGGPVAADWQG